MNIKIQFVAETAFCEHIGDGNTFLDWREVKRRGDGVSLLVLSCPICQIRTTFFKSNVPVMLHVTTLMKHIPPAETPEEKENEIEPTHFEREFTLSDVKFMALLKLPIPPDLREQMEKSYYSQYYLSLVTPKSP